MPTNEPPITTGTTSSYGDDRPETEAERLAREQRAREGHPGETEAERLAREQQTRVSYPGEPGVNYPGETPGVRHPGETEAERLARERRAREGVPSPGDEGEYRSDTGEPEPGQPVAGPYEAPLTANPTQEEIDQAAAEGVDVELIREQKIKGNR